HADTRHPNGAERPVARDLLVLRVEDAAGKPIAHAVNFAAHPTMIPAGVRKFSADYPGALAAVVEKETGAPCLFLQGAAGDLSPNPGEHAGPEKFGRALGREAPALARTARCPALDKPALRASDDDFRFAPRIDLQNPVLYALLERAYFPELIAFYAREYRDGVRPHLSTALLDGRIGFVG